MSAIVEARKIAEIGARVARGAAVGLRNRIAHQYGTLDLALVFEAARDDLGDLERFAACAAAWPDA